MSCHEETSKYDHALESEKRTCTRIYKFMKNYFETGNKEIIEIFFVEEIYGIQPERAEKNK